MNTNEIDLAKIEDYLLNLLPRAGQILRRYFHTENLTKQSKGKLDFVTAADLAVDEFIIHKLRADYPGIPVLTEETAGKDFDKYKNEDWLWVVDPLDGTANFARGDANYSISIGLVTRGISKVGVLFLPSSGRMFWAREDKDGAFWNGRNIYVSQISMLHESTVCTDWSHILSTRDQTTDFLRKIFGEVRQIKILGSAATDISLLARGAIDIYHHVHLMPWDTAASVLIAQKAGAIVTDTKGNIWNIFTPDILSANPILHAKILKVLCNQ